MTSKELARKAMREREKKINKRVERLSEWYNLRPVLGCSNWAIFHILLGGREAGKSYAVMDFCVSQYVKRGRPFFWMRLEKESAAKLLKNNANDFIDADIRRRYGFDLITKGECIYEVLKRGKKGKNGEIGAVLEKSLMARVLNLSTFYNSKGQALFDKDFLNDPKMYYNIVLDEMNREATAQKNTFDIQYAFVNQLENIVRSTKQRVRVFMIGNTLEEASDLLCAFNFLPEEFGVFNLKKKRAVIEYIEPSKKYLERRKGTIADILMPNASTFTNKVKVDSTLVSKIRLVNAMAIIKFSKNEEDWFTLWNDDIISRWKGQTKITVYSMRPYIDEKFIPDIQKMVILNFDNRVYKYRDLITFKMFQKQLELLKPRK